MIYRIGPMSNGKFIIQRRRRWWPFWETLHNSRFYGRNWLGDLRSFLEPHHHIDDHSSAYWAFVRLNEVVWKNAHAIYKVRRNPPRYFGA